MSVMSLRCTTVEIAGQWACTGKCCSFHSTQYLPPYTQKCTYIPGTGSLMYITFYLLYDEYLIVNNFSSYILLSVSLIIFETVNLYFQ
jgi:hypothetical protein